MKKSIVIITVLLAGLLAGTVITTSCTSKKAGQDQKEGEDHKHAEGEEHDKEMVYACPMHPEVTGKEGDKCSKCSMKLELVKSTDSTKVHEH